MPNGVVRVGRDRVGQQAALVELLRDVVAHIRVQAEGALEEEAAVGRDRRLPGEQVLEHRRLGAVRVRALQHLAELLRVADEHDVVRAGRHRAGVGERDLAGLVDEEVVEPPVELGVGEEPGRAAEQLRVRGLLVLVDVLDLRAGVLRLGVAAARLLHPVEGEPELGRARLDLGQELVDRPVARRGDADRLARGEQAGDQPARRPRLARAGRALDHEVAPVEREQQGGHLLEVRCLHVAVEGIAAEDALRRRDSGACRASSERPIRSSASSWSRVR